MDTSSRHQNSCITKRLRGPQGLFHPEDFVCDIQRTEQWEV